MALALAATILLGSGCMTLDTRFDRGYEGPRTYSGSRYSLNAIGQSFLGLNVAMALIFMVDLPFSFVADTLLLPITIGEEGRRKEGQVDRSQLAVEVAGPVQPVANASDEVNAERLFERCVGYFETHNTNVADCYAVDAQVRSGGRQYTGAEYKRVVTTGLLRVKAAGGFFSYTHATYAAQENRRVEVSARRAASFARDHTPATFLVAPGPDGYWRIIQSDEPPWPD